MTRRTIPAAIAITLWYASAGAETHRFVPTTFYNTFSFAHPPALRIKSGDRVITTTIDSASGSARGVAHPDARLHWNGSTKQGGRVTVDLVKRTASMLMGRAVEYEIANVVDPHFTVVAKLRRAQLRRP